MQVLTASSLGARKQGLLACHARVGAISVGHARVGAVEVGLDRALVLAVATPRDGVRAVAVVVQPHALRAVRLKGGRVIGRCGMTL